MSTFAKIGVLGGAFDPPHNAHVALAQAAATQLACDPIIILPTGKAWHKARPLTAAWHRVAMARLAFSQVPQAIIDTREIERLGQTYTIDTLTQLHDEHPQAELFLIMGQDQYQSFATWHRWQDIMKLATLCVAARGNERLKKSPIPCQVLHLACMPVSSTDIRQTWQQNAHNHPSSIASYIQQHHLYRDTA